MAQASRGVQIDARPFPLTIDPSKTAVIVVDMQHGFGGAGGWFDRSGADVSSIQAVVEPIARVLTVARRVGMPVVYLTGELEHVDAWMDARLARYFADVGAGREVPAPEDRTNRSGVKDSDILTELAPQPDDVIVIKPRHSGFYHTNLDAILRERDITSLVFTGCTTSVCVESTLRDAYFRDYRCLLLADCTAEPIGNHLPHTNHEASLLLVELVFGWVSESAALVRALTEHGVAAAAT